MIDRLSLSLRPVVLCISLGVVASAVVGCAPPASDDSPAAGGAPVAIAVAAAEGSGEPYLSSHGDDVWLSWLEPTEGDDWALRVATLVDGEVGDVHTVVERDDFFVNWADFPAVEPLPDGRLVAHWLQRGGQGTYDYGVRVVWSDDGGQSWSDPWTPHDDGTPTEHGFVSLMPGAGEGLGLVWLDGRNHTMSDEGAHTAAMSLRFRSASGPGQTSVETLVDDMVCDCCQTGAAATTDGWVMVYRDRTDDEIRDISIRRWVDGAWSIGRPVHRDGWQIASCPVNGPAVDAAGERVAVAWFTGAGDLPRVSLAVSLDQGDTFGEPVRIDDGDPVGRVDVTVDDTGALVSWIERVGEAAELRVRRVRADGTREPAVVVTSLSSARASGFPRMIAAGDDLVFAWTEAGGAATRVRAAQLVGGLPR